MSVSHASAIRATFQPGPAGLSEKPKPGMEGITTWNASAASPPCATGSVSGPISCRNSRTEPGQPWQSSSGTAPGSGERTCRKWIPNPSISVREEPSALRSRSQRRQS